MGSPGTYKVVSDIVRSFEGQPYRVIAPVKFILDRGAPIRVPNNVIVTDWLPATKVSRMVDVSVIHGGVGTIMTAAYAGKPIVGIGMQPEQVANIACLARKGIAVRVRRSARPGAKVQEAISQVLANDEMKRAAAEYAHVLEKWDGPRAAADSARFLWPITRGHRSILKLTSANLLGVDRGVTEPCDAMAPVTYPVSRRLRSLAVPYGQGSSYQLQ